MCIRDRSSRSASRSLRITCCGVCLRRFIRVPSSPILIGARNSHKGRCDDDVARYERTRSIGGSADVVERCSRSVLSWPVPTPTCVVRLLVGGVRSSGESRSGCSFHPGGGG